MQRCSHCQFPCPDTAPQCGWCAHALTGAPREATSPYPRTATLPIAPPPVLGGRDLASTVALHAPPLPSAARALPTAAASNMPTQAEYPAWAAPTGYAPTDGQGFTGVVPRPSSSPLPTASGDVPRAWLAILPVTLALAWLLGRGAAQWDQALLTMGRVCFAGAVALVGVAVWLAQRGAGRRAPALPLALAGCLVGLWCLSGVLAQPALALQAHAQEASGDYHGAMVLYHQSGDNPDALRSQLEWGRALTDAGDFAAAQAQLQPLLGAATGALQDEARAALGHLLWRWGQALDAGGDLAGTRAKWSEAASTAPGTTDGDAARAALAAPQSVTGHITWHGEALPGERVALVSAWSFSPDFHILQVTGERLPATSGDDGGFTITGVRPGVTYTLIWEGQNGDVTSVNASGQPVYTITLQPLAGGDLGVISIES